MVKKLFRNLTPTEKAIIDRLLVIDFPGRDEIVRQLGESRVRTIDEDGGLEIQTLSPVKASSVKSRVPTEGEAEDSDGITIHFLLHIVDDKVAELEIYKEDNSRIHEMPEASNIRVFAPE